MTNDYSTNNLKPINYTGILQYKSFPDDISIQFGEVKMGIASINNKPTIVININTPDEKRYNQLKEYFMKPVNITDLMCCGKVITNVTYSDE